MAAKVQLWDQQPGEPDAAFKRFLVYLYLGPGRTLNSAYRRSVPASDRVESRRATGTWHADSRQWNWMQRADAFDIYNLRRHGQRAIIAYVRRICRLSDKLDRALRKIKPETWEECLETHRVIGQDIAAEDIAALAARGDAAGDDAPADGSPPGPDPLPQ